MRDLAEACARAFRAARTTHSNSNEEYLLRERKEGLTNDMKREARWRATVALGTRHYKEEVSGNV